MDSKLRVHIATVDHHIERITEPMINLRADKAYIVTYGEKDAAAEFLKKTEKILRKHRIPYKVIFVDIWDLMACVQKFRDLIMQERENQIFFNVFSRNQNQCHFCNVILYDLELPTILCKAQTIVR